MQDGLPQRQIFHTGNVRAERGTRVVMWITAAMMVVEIIAGWWFNSMALLADGWHMSSHAMAIGISAFAYAAARRYANDQRFAFGTWKIEILGGFAGAIFLLGVAAMMVAASLERLFAPELIRYQEAMLVAALGLLVNIVCALILGGAHEHGHHHGAEHDEADHHEHHHDLNLRSAYLHVLADAATSVLAIAALAGGWLWGWNWLDPVMGLVGALLVASWAKNLLRDTGKVLLDCEMNHPVVGEIVDIFAESAVAARVVIEDLRVWRVGAKVYACSLILQSRDSGLHAAEVRSWLAIHEEIVFSTIEIAYCEQMTA